MTAITGIERKELINGTATIHQLSGQKQGSEMKKHANEESEGSIPVSAMKHMCETGKLLNLPRLQFLHLEDGMG